MDQVRAFFDGFKKWRGYWGENLGKFVLLGREGSGELYQGSSEKRRASKARKEKRPRPDVPGAIPVGPDYVKRRTGPECTGHKSQKKEKGGRKANPPATGG